MEYKSLTKLFLVVVFLFAVRLNAQVTIGSKVSPNAGSLLDLKEFDSTDLRSQNGSNAEKGIIMPRIALTDLNSLSDIIKTTITQSDNDVHIGLTIYNIKRTATYCPGLYVWNGKSWSPLGNIDPPAYTNSDINNPNSYIVSSGSTQLVPVIKAFAIWDTYAAKLGDEKLMVNCGEAILLWEDTNGLVSNTNSASNWILPIIDGKIKVETGAGLYGNAVIAFKIGNDIRWSWHIWIPNGDPRSNTLATNNGQPGGDYVWMDRNLGAHATSPEDQNNDGIKTFGLLYQWGRKDPFPSSSAVRQSAPGASVTIPLYGYQTTIIKDSIVTQSEIRNFRGAITSPLSFRKASTTIGVPWDWYTATQANQWPELWGYNSGKSPFDPCPQGWRVPTYKGTVLTSPWNGNTFMAANFPINLTVTEWSSAGANLVTGRGRTTTATPRHFYPTPSLISNTSASYDSPGTSTRIWTAMPDGNYGSRHIMYTSSDVNVQNMGGSSRASGYSVRCVKE